MKSPPRPAILIHFCLFRWWMAKMDTPIGLCQLWTFTTVVVSAVPAHWPPLLYKDQGKTSHRLQELENGWHWWHPLFLTQHLWSFCPVFSGKNPPRGSGEGACLGMAIAQNCNLKPIGCRGSLFFDKPRRQHSFPVPELSLKGGIKLTWSAGLPVQ